MALRAIDPDEDARCVALHPATLRQCVLISGHDGMHREDGWAGQPPQEWRPGQRPSRA